MATYYKDAQANVFRDDGKPVTMGNTDPALDWNKLGLNVDHLAVGSPNSGNFVRSTPVVSPTQPQQPQQPASPYANNSAAQGNDFYKTKVPVTAQNPGGYDIYKSDGTKVDYNTFQSLALNDTWIKERAPAAPLFAPSFIGQKFYNSDGKYFKTLSNGKIELVTDPNEIQGIKNYGSITQTMKNAKYYNLLTDEGKLAVGSPYVGNTAMQSSGTSGIVGGSGNVSGEYGLIGKDITAGLSQYGIKPPGENTMDDVIKATAEIDKRREELRKRKEEDVARIESSYAAGKEDLEIDQKESYDKAVGRATYGDMLTSMEVDDLQKLERRNRIDMIAFEGQHQGALREAQRAYEDGDYLLASDKVKEAKDLEKANYDPPHNHFHNTF